jgi:Na+/H+ antiporter NhaD/arsenite permease-like protein
MMTLAASIFVITYVIIIWDKFDRMPVALAGAMTMIFAGVLNQEEAIRAIDFNTVFLLLSMMILVNILRHTGAFGWAGVHVVRLSGGRPWPIMLAFALFTAVVSAFLDNVTTVLLILPITLAVSEQLEIDPRPLLISQAIASNIGGTATLIGDPPNIMIGSATGFDFLFFVYHLTPVIIIVLGVTCAGLWLIYGRRYGRDGNGGRGMAALSDLESQGKIVDPALLRKSIVVIGLTVVGFFFQGMLHLQAATIALTGATALLLLAPNSMHKALEEVEWNTILFFVGLFIMVGAVEKAGFFELAAHGVIGATGGSITVTAMVILWFSGVTSAIVDNIPAVASLIPVVSSISRLLHPGIADEALRRMPDILALWWALSLGACLGGNATLYGASANVVVAGAAGRRGKKITFWEFTKVGTPLTVAALLICSVYIYLRYLM